MITFRCDSCGRGLRVSESHAGKKGRCPKCSSIVRVPCADPEIQESETSMGMSNWRDGEMHLKRESMPVGPSPKVPDWASQRVEDSL